MGTEVHYKGQLPGYHSMRDLSEDSNSSNWPLFYGDKTFTNGQFCNGFMSRTKTDAYPGYNKDVLKQKMLEHESVFKDQVVELHRLYRIQRDMMDRIKREELHNLRASEEPSSSSSLIGSHVPSEDARKWHITSFPSANSGYARPSQFVTGVVNSQMSSSKRNGGQFGQCQMQNGCSSKICEVSEVRPSKVRKKLFDLQIPADEYEDDTDQGEQLRANGGSFNPSYCVNGNCVVTQESTTNFCLGDDAVAKSNCGKNALTSNSCLRSSIVLADLNEPAQLEEATPSPVDFLGYGNNHRETRGINVSAKSNAAFVGSPRETTWNSHHPRPNGSLNSLYVDSKGKEREWLSSAYETGHVKGLAPVPQSLEQDKLPTPSRPAAVMFNNAYQPPGMPPFHNTRDELWKQRTVHNLETFRIKRETNYTQVEPFGGSQNTIPHPYTNSSELADSWSHTAFSWGKPRGDFAQRPSFVCANPSVLSSAISKSSQASQNHGIFGEKRHINDSSRLNPGLASDLPIWNRHDHGFSSASKESPFFFQSVAFSSLNHGQVDTSTSECFSTNEFQNFVNSTNNMNSMSEKGFDLNLLFKSSLNEGPSNMNSTSRKGFDLNLLSESSLNEGPSRCDIELVDGKRELQDPSSVFPWLKAKQSGRNEDNDTMRGGDSAVSGSSQAYASPPFCHTNTSTTASSLEDCNMRFTKEVGGTRGITKILGVPILENSLASKNESSLVSTSVALQSSTEGENFRQERRKMVIDINMPYDLSMTEPEKPAAVELLVAEKVMETETSSIRNCFDLNTCITEDEDPLPVESNNVKLKAILEIDLEAPIVLDEEQTNMPEEGGKQQEESLRLPEDKTDRRQDEIVKTAAEAIVAISSYSQFIRVEKACSDPCDDPLESLRWFVDIVSSCADEPENRSGRETISKDGAMVAHSTAKELDYFEAMTLQLTETKEEDYLPRPFVPEVQTVEDAGAVSLTNRPRRGNARRGRQRRDFQRDILPGLSSLSRHEVTEDLQTFGSLMRATGHLWNTGSTRRTGTRNGRSRRTVIEIPIAPATVVTPISPPVLHQLNNIEPGLEDKSLTGWGKTTRRPRRQRCPAGNPPVRLT